VKSAARFEQETSLDFLSYILCAIMQPDFKDVSITVRCNK